MKISGITRNEELHNVNLRVLRSIVEKNQEPIPFRIVFSLLQLKSILNIHKSPTIVLKQALVNRFLCHPEVCDIRLESNVENVIAGSVGHINRTPVMSDLPLIEHGDCLPADMAVVSLECLTLINLDFSLENNKGY